MDATHALFNPRLLSKHLALSTGSHPCGYERSSHKTNDLHPRPDGISRHGAYRVTHPVCSMVLAMGRVKKMVVKIRNM